MTKMGVFTGKFLSAGLVDDECGHFLVQVGYKTVARQVLVHRSKMTAADRAMNAAVSEAGKCLATRVSLLTSQALALEETSPSAKNYASYPLAFD